jgi:outer membrane biosynthesis protein TonB
MTDQMRVARESHLEQLRQKQQQQEQHQEQLQQQEQEQPEPDQPEPEPEPEPDQPEPEQEEEQEQQHYVPSSSDPPLQFSHPDRVPQADRVELERLTVLLEEHRNVVRNRGSTHLGALDAEDSAREFYKTFCLMLALVEKHSGHTQLVQADTDDIVWSIPNGMRLCNVMRYVHSTT